MSPAFYRTFYDVMVPWGGLLICSAFTAVGMELTVLLDLFLDVRTSRKKQS